MDKKKLNLKTSNIFILSFFVFFLFVFSFGQATAVNASSLYFSPSSGEYELSKVFSVNVFVSSLDQQINAVSGTISFPKDKIEVISFSKAGSIISFWVQEPSFSNSVGTLSFEGVVFNPGFIGSSGKIITINFKTKGTGNASLDFISALVLANDGKGTNILKNQRPASFNILPKTEEIFLPEDKTPLAPKVSSLTHPDSAKWYSNNNPKFSWEVPPGVDGVSFYFSKSPTSNPGSLSDGILNSKSYENIEDGIWYFHIKFRNSHGWGLIGRFKVQIDKTPPLPFYIETKEKEIIRPGSSITFEATDEMSGIDYYELRIGQNEPIITKEKEYKLGSDLFGENLIVVKAVDMAGNYTFSAREINIFSIDPPVIIEYSENIAYGDLLFIKGTSVADSKIEIFILDNEEKIKIGQAESDKNGEWSFTRTESLRAGIYQVFAETIDSSGVRSRPSEMIIIRVNHLVFVKIGNLSITYFSVFIIFLFLITILILLISFAWINKVRKRKRLIKMTTEAEKTLYKTFKNLKEDIEKEIAKLDGHPDLSKREAEIFDNLKKYLKFSEKIIIKKIKDIQKNK
jgi:hypothetical protein